MNVRRKTLDVRRKTRRFAISKSSDVSRLTFHVSQGFTLIEILVAITILSIVMSILYGTFSTSSANAKVVEERSNELSSLSGAVDIISQEIRGVYSPSDGSSEGFLWKEEGITFTAMTPFVKDDEPLIQRISYIFNEGKLLRKTFKAGLEAETKGESLLLDELKDPSFSFYDGKEWVKEWPSAKDLPSGIKVAFSYKGRDVETVIPVLSAKKYP